MRSLFSRATSLFLSLLMAASPAGATNSSNGAAYQSQPRVHQMVIPQATMDYLDRTAPGTKVYYSYGGSVYQATYRDKDCSTGQCEYFADDIIYKGPAGSSHKAPPHELTILKELPSQGTAGVGSAGGAAGTSGTPGASGTSGSSGASRSGGASGPVGAGQTGSEANAPGGKNGFDFGSSLDRGISAGIAAGAITAFQDYLILTPGSQRELQAKQRELHEAQTRAEAAYEKLVRDSNLNQQLLEAQLERLSRSMEAVGQSQMEFDKFIQGFELPQAPKAAELQRILQDLESSASLRPAFKSAAQDIVARYENAPNIHTATTQSFKQIAAASLGAAVKSELINEPAIADINLEMAKKALDVVYGLDPYTGIHRDLYELVTGKNIVTGNDISTFERGVSAVGVAGFFVTAGVSSSLSNGLKAGYRMLAVAGRKASVGRAMKVIESAKSIVRALKENRIPLHEGFDRMMGFLRKQVRRTGDVPLAQIEDSSQKILREGVSQGQLKTLAPLSDLHLRSPHHPEALKRIQEIVPDGIRISSSKVIPGTSGRVALIGRPMQAVQTAAQNLRREGFNVEVFDAELMEQMGKVSPISKEALRQYDSAITKVREGIVSPQNAYEFLKNQKIHQENRAWLNEVLRNSDTVIDLGDTSGSAFRSPHYDMELSIFNSIRGKP